MSLCRRLEPRRFFQVGRGHGRRTVANPLATCTASQAAGSGPDSVSTLDTIRAVSNGRQFTAAPMGLGTGAGV